MYKSRWNLLLVAGIVSAIAIACNWSTAKIGSLKTAKDEAGKEETSKFGPGDKVYIIADVANNPGKVSVKFRVLYDDVKGQKSGDLVQNAEKTLEFEGSRPAIFWLTLPPSGFENGRYKVDVVMKDDKGEQKDQKSATFDIAGYTAPSTNADEN